jgi:hypothetical protein
LVGDRMPAVHGSVRSGALDSPELAAALERWSRELEGDLRSARGLP